MGEKQLENQMFLFKVIYCKEFRFDFPRGGSEIKREMDQWVLFKAIREIQLKEDSQEVEGRKPKFLFSFLLFHIKINNKQQRQHPCIYLNNKIPKWKSSESLSEPSAWPGPHSIKRTSILITTNTQVSLCEANGRHRHKLEVRAAQLSWILQHFPNCFLLIGWLDWGSAAPINAFWE